MENLYLKKKSEFKNKFLAKNFCYAFRIFPIQLHNIIDKCLMSFFLQSIKLFKNYLKFFFLKTNKKLVIEYLFRSVKNGPACKFLAEDRVK